MSLYDDANPSTTLNDLGFRDKKTAIDSVKKNQKLYKKQKIPAYSSNKTLPKKYIKNKEDSYKYYRSQTVYRILGLLNRAKSMITRIKNKESIKNIKEAICILEDNLRQVSLVH